MRLLQILFFLCNLGSALVMSRNISISRFSNLLKYNPYYKLSPNGTLNFSATYFNITLSSKILIFYFYLLILFIFSENPLFDVSYSFVFFLINFSSDLFSFILLMWGLTFSYCSPALLVCIVRLF